MWKNIRLFWSLTAICLGGALVVSWAGPAGAVPYSKKPIYDDTNISPTASSNDAHFHFSQNGDIVYLTEVLSPEPSTYVLHLYHHGDGSVTQIASTTDIMGIGEVQINDQGQVVWVEKGQIYLYQDGLTKSISGSSFYGSAWPKLNNRGQVVYMTYRSSGSEIYLYDGHASGLVPGNTDYANYSPVINDNGQIAWLGASTTDTEYHVYFFDGSTSRKVSTTGNAAKLQINQDGWIIWEIGVRTPTPSISIWAATRP